MAVPVEETFLYFAYGSNLLKKRIRINNPSAEFIGIGKLDGYRLDFTKYSDHWRGTSATIVPCGKTHIWGAVWRLNIKDMPALDWQEGVGSNWYFPKTVDISTPEGSTVQCRTYEQTIPPPPRESLEDLPSEDRPSTTYLDCIINGAVECKLPEDYIKELSKIPHNGQKASPKMIEKLNM